MSNLTKQDILNTLNAFYGSTVYLDFNTIPTEELELANFILLNNSVTNSSNYTPQTTITKAYVAATNLNAYKVVRTDNNNQLVYADNNSLQITGIVVANCVAGQSVSVVVIGIVTNSIWNWDINKPVYLSSNGILTQTTPVAGSVIQIGNVLDPTSIRIHPNIIYLNNTYTPEVTSFRSRSTITDDTATKLDNLFISPLKNAGIDLSKVDCGLFLGNTTADCLQKLLYTTGVSPTLVLNSGSGLQINQANGLVGNGSGWVDTGYRIADQNLALNNRFIAIYTLTANSTYSWYALCNGDLSTNSTTLFGANNAAICLTYLNNSASIHYPCKGLKSVNSASTNVTTYTRKSSANYTPATPSTTSGDTTSFNLLSIALNGARYSSNANIGGYFISPALTETQVRILSDCFDSLFSSLGRNISETTALFFGDSITQGTLNPHEKNYSAIVATARNATELNRGIAGSVLESGGNASNNGYSRYVNDIIYMAPTEVYIMYGTNDLTYIYSNTAGYSIANFQSQLNTIVGDLKIAGISRIVLSSTIPLSQTSYNNRPGAMQQYIDCKNAVKTVAINQQVYFADCFQAYINRPNGWEDLLADGVHPSESGSTLIAQTILNATLVT